MSKMTRDNYHFKAFQMSVAVHALIIFIIIGMGGSLKPSDKLLVIDFRMENPIGTTKGNAGATAFENRHRMETIIPKPGIIGETQKQQTDQESTREEQVAEAPVLPTQLRETTASEIQPQAPSQSNPDAGLADSRQPVAVLYSLDKISHGRTGSTDGLMDKKGSVAAGNAVGYGGVPIGSSGPNEGGYLRKNFFYIRDMIQKKITYPALAKRMGWEGKVIVSFLISARGEAMDIIVSKSSGHKVLDDNAADAVRNASPFPKPPAKAQIIIPILYSLT
ncbi:MAG: energy transducer TonB [Nitrospirota bacterium]